MSGTNLQEDCDTLRVKHPNLSLVNNCLIEGILNWDADYQGYRIITSAPIKIILPDDYPNSMPSLRLEHDALKRILDKQGISDVASLHYNQGHNEACLCPATAKQALWSKGSDLTYFVDQLVTPYLYGLAFFERFGRWPWGEYLHGAAGLLEFYSENATTHPNIAEKTIVAIQSLADKADAQRFLGWIRGDIPLRGHSACPCGSGNNFRKCHPVVFEAVISLKNQLSVQPK